MTYTIETIADFCGGEAHITIPGSMVGDIMIDHRDTKWQRAMFVAITGAKTDGHAFIPALVEQGVRHFLVSKQEVAETHAGEANFIVVDDVVTALQRIATKHRENFTKIPVIGITGSNGKTIVKEWLNTLLEGRHNICRSPKSFNSQIGAALSVIQLKRSNTLGIFEAGISKPGEMQRLQHMLNPTIGIFTNLGDAHAAHFTSDEEKRQEKWKLFQHTEQVICCSDHAWFGRLTDAEREKCFTWSYSEKADVSVNATIMGSSVTLIKTKHEERSWEFHIPFTDRASVENAVHCFCVLLLLDMCDGPTLARFEHLMPIAMRMEVKQGIENTILIDDSYNSDLGSLRAALEQLNLQRGRDRLVILTDMSDNSGSSELYGGIASMMQDASVEELIGIGPEIEKNQAAFAPIAVACFPDPETYWQNLDPKTLRNKAILIKGARKFRLEQLVKRLQAQQHETYLEVDLQKLSENLRFFRSHVKDECRIMVMVKAFGYGSGGYEVANFLQAQKVDYLAVAYADEGVELRTRGIHMPIMVMSPAKSAYESMIRNELEPEIYSMRSLNEFIETAKSMRHLFSTLNIHLKIDSGMHRLGFQREDVEGLLAKLAEAPFIRVVSIFTHLSAADVPGYDEFSAKQVQQYQGVAKEISSQMETPPLRHVLNSTGILRFPQYQFDMVRLGIGLYGFSGSEENKFLHALGAFKTYIIQIREVAAHEPVGYNREGKSDHERRIATVAVGYADGLDRRLGHGNWKLRWQGVECPIVGNVCMDMCMIDVSHTQAQEGDEVTVFEGSTDVEKMATALSTIPYEILTKISHRVRRVYLQE